MDILRQDLRYAWRALLNRPGFSVLTLLMLAIGIGVNTVAFSAINALLFKPLRFEDAHELGRIHTTGTNSPYRHLSWPDFADLERESRSFQALAAEARVPVAMRNEDGSQAEQVWSLLVSSNYLSAMRARPLIGRFFTEDDISGSELTAVASERFWVERLGGGSSTAGRRITLNGRSVSIIGVVPEGFQGPGGFFEPQLWLPLERAEALGVPGGLRTRKETWLAVIGRLMPGISAAQGQADLQGIMAQLARDYPSTNAGRGVTFTPVTEPVPEMRAIAPFAWLALSVVALVLLIACFNVAGLLLARASERQREMGVRAALGAGRGRILRQLVTEGLILASIGGALALVLSSWTADVLAVFSLPSPIPQQLHITLDRRLIAFTLCAVVLAGVVPALVPALHAMRADVVASLRRDSSAGGRPSRMRNGLVIAQVAGSTLFLASALLFVRSFVNNASYDPGFDVAHAVVLEMTPSTYGYSAPRTRALLEQLVERLEALPGVDHAALADRVPFYVGFPKTSDVAEDGVDCATTKCRTAAEYGVSTGHFAALGVQLRSGRDLNEQEYRTDADVAVINATMAAGLWPGDDAVGKWLRVGSAGRRLQIIGVAADIKHRYMAEPPGWYIYRPLRQAEFGDRVTVVVGTAADPRTMIGAIQQQVQVLDPDLPAGTIKTMAARMEMPLWPARTAAGFFLICGALALVLATVGLFGVTYYAVSGRVREFGVRAALGATPHRITAQVLREGLALSLPGVLIGVLGATLAMRVLARGLFGVGPADPLTYAGAAALQLIVALIACSLPAYRATRVDPMTALRND
jgi:predicted permease